MLGFTDPLKVVLFKVALDSVKDLEVSYNEDQVENSWFYIKIDAFKKSIWLRGLGSIWNSL
jgi:hypothetical protein